MRAWNVWLVTVGMMACGKSGPREAASDTTPAVAAADVVTVSSADTAPAAADTEPAAEADTEPAAADTEPAAAADTEPAAADAEPAKALPQRPAKGIVPDEELDGLWEVLGTSKAVDRKAQFSSARGCVESLGPDKPNEACEQVPDGILAVMGQDVAVRIADDVGECGDMDEAWGWVASTDKPKPRERVKLFTGDVDDAWKLQAAVWRHVVALAEKGFQPAKSLVVASLEAQSGIRAYSPLAYLASPLDGYFLHSQKNDKGDSTLSIVSADNQTKFELGVIPVLKNKSCKGQEREESACGDFGDTGFEDAALSADGTTLFVLGSQSDGSHCGGSPTFFRAYPVPAALLGQTGVDKQNP